MPVVNGQATHNNQDLLAEIFGSSPAAPSPTPGRTPSISSQPQKSSVQDILGLFDSSPSPSPASPAPAPSTAAFATFSPQPQSQAPPRASPQQQHPPAPRLTSYTAYEKQELKITLTPQTSAARPGVVNIMARFQVSGSNTATGLNFQAAVPKVRIKSQQAGDPAELLYSHSNCRCFPCQILMFSQVPRKLNKCV